ncbi:hypothetical protein HDU98_007417 [Podochytrium sp. JEL0797]|nr:hypothetical protein HDU98_007417 [Podochytrium sp. JEL0797]
MISCLTHPFHTLTRLAKQYGPAWILASQLVSTSTFLLLWTLLVLTHADANEISNALQIPLESSWRRYISMYGLPAAAWVLNRVIFPVRIVLEVLLVRQIHEPVNRVLGPYWEFLWGKVYGWFGWEKSGEGELAVVVKYNAVDGEDVVEMEGGVERDETDLAPLCLAAERV